MGIEYLFAGFAVFWAGIFVYVVLLQNRLRSLQREIEHLEERVAEAETMHAPAVTRPARPGATTPSNAASETPPTRP